MASKRLFAIWPIIILAISISGCGDNRVKTEPDDPVKKYKQEFLLKYGFFVMDGEVVSYYQDSLSVTGKEKDIFNNLTTIEDVDKFIEVFWKIRDYDPNTPENEFKDIIDQRIKDIDGEIFARDSDIPLTSFSRSGGLRGDLARVYLLRGAPSFKAKLQDTAYRVEIMVWYYIDVTGHDLFRFLFYDNGGTMKLLRNQWTMLQYEDWFNPLSSPLRAISKRPGPDPNDLYEVFEELLRDDTERIFLLAMQEFSYYGIDVVMEGGNPKKNKFGALDPPEPISLTAQRYKPTLLGQPGDLTEKDLINNEYSSFIPADLVITKDDRPSFILKIGYADTDWEVKDGTAETVLDLRISFQNKKTRALREFWVSLPVQKPREEVDRKRGVVSMSIVLDDTNNFAGGSNSSQGTLSQLISELEPGIYVVNVDLRHTVTKKFVGGWREVIAIR